MRSISILAGITALVIGGFATTVQAAPFDDKKPPQQDGYIPDEPRDAPPVGQGGFGMAPPPAPLRLGLNLGFGSHVPVAGDYALNDGTREFTPTLDFGGSMFFLLFNMIQLDIGARGGFGGLNSGLYEERYRYSELQARHLFVGAHARFFPIDIFGMQPFVSAQLGADRVFASRMDGTGVYECVDNGWTVRCEEEEERTFAAGYWGSSVGLGAGLRFFRQDWPVAVTAEAMWMRNRYGVRTQSGLPNDRLEETAAVMRDLGILVMLHVPFN